MSDPVGLDMSEWRRGADGLLERDAARVIVLDPSSRVLLFQGKDVGDDDHRWWFTPGGGIKAGESPIAAAVRELQEETGIEAPPESLTGPIAYRTDKFFFHSRTVRQRETYYGLELERPVALSRTGWTELERAVMLEGRWWSAAELATTRQTYYPEQLRDLLPLVTRGRPGQPVILGEELE